MTCERMVELKRRGVRVLPGGDYGFPWNPHGNNARDLAFFVDLLGYTPMEAIVAATSLGGELMGRPASSAWCAKGRSPTSCSSTAIRSTDVAICRRASASWPS